MSGLLSRRAEVMSGLLSRRAEVMLADFYTHKLNTI